MTSVGMVGNTRTIGKSLIGLLVLSGREFASLNKWRTPRFRIPCTLKKLIPCTPPQGHSLQIVHAPYMVEDGYRSTVQTVQVPYNYLLSIPDVRLNASLYWTTAVPACALTVCILGWGKASTSTASAGQSSPDCGDSSPAKRVGDSDPDWTPRNSATRTATTLCLTSNKPASSSRKGTVETPTSISAKHPPSSADLLAPPPEDTRAIEFLSRASTCWRRLTYPERCETAPSEAAVAAQVSPSYAATTHAVSEATAALQAVPGTSSTVAHWQTGATTVAEA